jgi:uncharacterized membrane protein YdjX (TVP38/TMEM64 family)
VYCHSSTRASFGSGQPQGKSRKLSDNAYTIPGMTHRRFVLALWIAAASAALSIYLFRPDLPRAVAVEIAGAPPWWTYAGYLALGCLRGFTLVPATYLVLMGMLVLPPLPLYALTLAGIVVSSAAVYFFADAMRLDAFFERQYGSQVARLRTLLAEREISIVIAWSFFPVAPTDLVCDVCGALRVDIRKCLIGIAIGEGTICAIYIFLGHQAMAWLR